MGYKSSELPTYIVYFSDYKHGHQLLLSAVQVHDN
jgi:hypothetical protein